MCLNVTAGTNPSARGVISRTDFISLIPPGLQSLTDTVSGWPKEILPLPDTLLPAAAKTGSVAACFNASIPGVMLAGCMLYFYHRFPPAIIPAVAHDIVPPCQLIPHHISREIHALLSASHTLSASNNIDYPMGDPIISHNDKDPWGVHLTGPYPDGVSYLASFLFGNATIGPIASLITPDTSKWMAMASVSTKASEYFSCVGRCGTRVVSGGVCRLRRAPTIPEHT